MEQWQPNTIVLINRFETGSKGMKIWELLDLKTDVVTVLVSQPSRSPEEELRDKIAELERMNTDLQMENDLLKKVRELERRDHYL